MKYRVFRNKNIVSYLILVLVAVLFWHPILFFGKMLWISDISRQYYPWYLELFYSLRNFTLPFWVPEMGAGYPLFAQGEVGVFYPINWFLIFLFSASFGFKISFLIHSIIAGFGLYLFANKIKIGSIAALFSALVFSYSFFFTARFIHPTILAASSYLPFGLLFVEEMFQHKKAKAGFFLSIVIALQLLAGHPQITFISLISYAFYFFLRTLFFSVSFGQVMKRFAVFVVSIFFGIGISSIQLFSTFELINYSSRIQEGTDFIFSYSLPKSHYLTYLFPYFFGISPTNSNFGFWQFGGHYWEFALYIGILPLIFAFIGGLFFQKNRYVKIFVLFFALFALLAIGGYLAPYRFFVRTFHLPFRVSARFLLPVTISLSILAGFGFDIILGKKISKRGIKVLSAFLFFLTAFLLGATGEKFLYQIPGFSYVRHFFQAFSQKVVFTEFQKVSFQHFSLGNPHIFVSFILIVVSIASIWLWKKKGFSRFTFILLSFGLFFTDSYFQGFLYQQTDLQKEILSPPPFLSQLKKWPQDRIMTFTEPSTVPIEKHTLQPNINLVWNISSINAVTPLPLLYHDSIYKIARDDLRMLSPLGITYLLSQEPLETSQLKLVDKNQFSYIYENKEVFPRAFMVYDYSVSKENEETFSLLREKIENLKRTVILSNYPPSFNREKISDVENYQIQQKLYTNKKVEFTVETKKNGIFVFLDSYYPSWKAFVDGVEVEIIRANGIFRAIYIPAGIHSVVFRYVPKMFYIGLTLTIFCSMTLMFLLKSNSLKGKI